MFLCTFFSMFGFQQHQDIPYVLEHLQQCSVCNPLKIFFTSQFSYVPFCNPTHKIETGTTNWLGDYYSKQTGRIIMMGHLETLSNS